MSAGSGFFDYGITAGPAIDHEPEQFLASASETDWSMLLAYGERRNVAAGEMVVEFGETTRELIIVITGKFRVTVPTGRRGRSRTVGHITAGSVLGEAAFFDGAPRTASVVAEENAEVFVLEWTSFERLAAVRPALAIRILSDLGTILSARFRRVSQEAFRA